jgi:hypothetical protein
MNDDDDDDKPPRIPVGDVGTILLAGVFLIGFLYLMFGPSPFQPLIDQASKLRASQNAAPGEVTVAVPEKQKN